MAQITPRLRISNIDLNAIAERQIKSLKAKHNKKAGECVIWYAENSHQWRNFDGGLIYYYSFAPAF